MGKCMRLIARYLLALSAVLLPQGLNASGPGGPAVLTGIRVEGGVYLHGPFLNPDQCGNSNIVVLTTNSP